MIFIALISGLSALILPGLVFAWLVLIALIFAILAGGLSALALTRLSLVILTSRLPLIFTCLVLAGLVLVALVSRFATLIFVARIGRLTLVLVGLIRWLIA